MGYERHTVTCIGIPGDLRAKPYLHLLSPLGKQRRVREVELRRRWPCTRDGCGHDLEFILRGFTKERFVYTPVEIDWDAGPTGSLRTIAERFEKAISDALDVLEGIAVLEDGQSYCVDDD